MLRGVLMYNAYNIWRRVKGSETTKARCEKCKKRTTKVIHRTFKYAADKLLIHLKRFNYDARHPRKNNAEIELTPIKLKINDVEVDYEVESVICHQGSLNSGHYTMNTLTAKGSWRCYDDSRTYQVASAPSNGYIILLSKSDGMSRRGKVWRH